ncbi:ECF transporter S component [Aerococcus urinae]|uniref:ECF transporter S component n=1 Tax=Aerococcus urinae TaxID=1376 RepID=UPI00227A8FD0|nr:ECF transporter S component [Aerococcus urinae]MCY3059454.1 ECF transporter S component [Aerococcus urinae]
MKNLHANILTALLLAIATIGTNVHFLGSIALDSFPAFLGAIILGPGYGFLLGLLSHGLTALLSGFPLTLPAHIIIGVMMGLTCSVYGYLRGKAGKSIGKILFSDAVALVFNVLLAQLALIPLLGRQAILAMVTGGLLLTLLIASVVNLVLAEVVYISLPAKFFNPFMKRKTK